MSYFPENDHSTLNQAMLYQALIDENRALKEEAQRLRLRLEEYEEHHRATREGEVNTLDIPGSEGEMVFTLDGADNAYRILVETVNEDMVIVDADFKITYVGKRLLDKAGLSEKEVIGASWTWFIGDEYETFINQKMEERQQGISDSYEIRSIDGNDLPYWFIVNSRPFFDENGKFKGALAMLIDITERKQAEIKLQEAYENIQIQSEELQVQSEELHSQDEELAGAYDALLKSEEHYRMLFTNMTEAFYLVEVIYDKNGKPYDYRFLEVNPAYELSLGVKKEQLLGKSLFDVFPNANPITIQKYNEIAVSGQSAHFEVFSQAVNGKYFDVYAFSPEKGKLAVIFRDITHRKRVEEALQESEAKARHLIKYAPAGIYEIDFSVPKYVNVNDVFCQMSGYTREELLNINPLELMVDSSKDKFIERIKKINDGQEVSSGEEYLVVGKHGQTLWVLINAKFTCENGKVVGATVVAHDITERKYMEAALQKAHDNLEEKIKERTSELEVACWSLEESEGNLAEAQRISHIGSWEWDILKDKTYCSDEMYRIFGVHDQPQGICFDTMLSYIHPDDQVNVNIAVNNALTGVPFNIDYRIILINGEERVVHEQGEVTFDNNNNPIRMRGTIQDITERKRIEEKIKKLANAVDSSNDAIITESVDGIIESWNKGAEQIYGYFADEVIAKHVSILEPENIKGEIKQLIEKTRCGEQIKRYETQRQHKNGTLIDASVTLSPVYDASGKFVAVSCISRDVTARKKAEAALVTAEIARKKELHHRIKNNLQVISSLLDLQADKFRSKMKVVRDDVINAFKESQDRVASMALIHEELYNGGRLHELHFAPYVDNLTKHLLKTYNVKNVDIDFKMDVVDDAFFNMDIAVPLGIIINELVSNSFKYAFKGKKSGEIEITLSRNGSNTTNTNFVLTVSDNGIGVAENLKIEDLDSLGMQLVVSLIEQLDGTLDLKRNDGTKFIVQFPINENN